ncbi:MAG: chromosomal replication initiator protein DnaA [Clostridia bacterium]|nr:chromosomal replication initiator protein DnaA [Clostridia bacterium]
MSNLNAGDLSAIWQIMLKTMQSENLISSTACDLWFKCFRLDYLDPEKAVFAVENEMKRNIILDKYSDLLATQIEQVIGYTPKIQIVTDTTLAPELNRTDGVPYPSQIVEERKAAREKDRQQALQEELAASDTLDRLRALPADPEEDKKELPDMRRGMTSPYLKEQYEDTERDPAYAEINITETEKSSPAPAGKQSGDRQLTYNEDYTFENFVVGNSNQFAHAAALSVAENVGMKINPLFIYGPSGLGKTHLMYAIANRALKRDASMKVIYVKGEEFLNQLIEAIRGGRSSATAEFRAKYRRADMLLIDDIQFIAGKESTQEEFFHTFDALYEDHKQIIITSDRPPKELTTLEERIRSRFEAGLIADIQPPDYELRLAILKNKADQNNLEVPIDVIDFLAENLQSNIRQIEGVIKKLGAKNLLSGMPITMDMVLTTLPEYLRDTEPIGDTVTRIVDIVARKYNVTPTDIMGTSRKKEIKNARNVAMYVVRQVTKMSLPQIGAVFARDHSTIHSNISMVESELTTNTLFEAGVAEIMKEVKRGG